MLWCQMLSTVHADDLHRISPIEQLILDAAAKLSGKQPSVLHWNTRLSEFAL